MTSKLLSAVHQKLNTAEANWRRFKVWISAIPEPVYDPSVRVKPTRSHLYVVGGIFAVWAVVQTLVAVGAYR